MKHLMLVIMLAGFGLTGCKEKKELDFISKELSEKKVSVLRVYNHNPYSTTEHQVFSEYFRAAIKYSGQLETLIKKGKGKKGGTNVREGRTGTSSSSTSEVRISNLLKNFPAICESIIISREVWRSINGSCEIGEYFVCNEEVRAYPATVRKLLSKSNGLVEVGNLGSTCSSWATNNEGESQ